MIGTEAQLGVAPAHEAELFVILSPVGPYFSTGVKPVNLVSFIWLFSPLVGFTSMEMSKTVLKLKTYF